MSNILYKYLNVDGAKLMLHYSNLMYANAMTFNDPFDCHPSLIDFSNVPPEACGGWPAQNIEDLHFNEHINYRKDLWICCLSKLGDSLLMWSYYNKHEGVCIGLNMDLATQYIAGEHGMIVSSQGKDVQYRVLVNKPDYYRDREAFFDYQVYTKAKEWEHEQEVRLFIYKPYPWLMRLLPFQRDRKEFNQGEIRAFIELGAECFESISFGVRIDKAEKKKIIQLARTLNPDIKVYQMVEDPTAFKLIAKEEMNFTLQDYMELFSNLHTNKQKGEKAPHKAIMLISVIELIATRHISTNKIAFTDELEACFFKNWERYIGETLVYKPKPGTPYWHLNSEPFWQLIPFVGGYAAIVELQKSNPYSSKIIREYIKYAILDKRLFELLQDEANREKLRRALFDSLGELEKE